MKNKFLGIFLVMIIFLSLGLVAAQQDNDEDVINAAYHRVTGALRIINEGKLRPQEILLSWNQLGPQGEMGPVGPKGEQGPQGVQGERGLQGEVGPVGPRGEVGPVGEMGPQGLVGPVGPKGEQGPQGVQGERGLQGEVGPVGSVGPVGPQGPEGVCSCPISSEMYDNLLARIIQLEESLELISNPIDFSSTTRTISYDALNMDSLYDFIYFQNTFYESVEISQYDNEYKFLDLKSINEGSDWVILLNESSNEKKVSAIYAVVFANGTMDLTLYPWLDGCFMEFTKDMLNLPDVENYTVSNEGVVYLDMTSFNLLYVGGVFALQEGETIINFTSEQGYEASIEVEVDENRIITRFDVNKYLHQEQDMCLPNPCTSPQEPYCEDSLAVNFAAIGICSQLDGTHSCFYDVETIDCSIEGLMCQEGMCVEIAS